MPHDKPKHPVYALTTYELAQRRNDVERWLKDLPLDTSARERLQRELAEIAEEEQSRASIARASRGIA